MAPDSDAFIGRVDELAALRQAMSETRSGQPRTLLVTGPAGIGKTSLIERFLAELADAGNARLLRANGEQWEALVAYGTADQLLRAAGICLDLVTDGRDDPHAGPVDVGALLLKSVEGIERAAPVVLFFDDIQWADIDSLRALLFALRRLVGVRVLTLLAARAEDLPGLPEGLSRLVEGRAGRMISLGALNSLDVQRVAAALGMSGFSLRTAQRLCEHTGGNPLYVRALLAELPDDRWHEWEPSLPAPSAFAERIVSRLSSCGSAARALVEACSVLGVRCTLVAAATLAQLADPVIALEEAIKVGLLEVTEKVRLRDVAFPHPLVQAAVYEHVAPSIRTRLHRAAGELLRDPGAVLRHQVAAALGPDDGLAESLEGFARDRMTWGAWASAASALMAAGRLSSNREQREQRLLRAVDAIASAGDLPQAATFVRDIESFAPGPLRDAAAGYLAVLHGRVDEAHTHLTAGWEQANRVADPHLATLLALRWTLFSVSRLRGADVVQWSDRAMALAPDESGVRLEAEALRGLGLGLIGQVPQGLNAYQAVLASVTADPGSIAGRLSMASSWLRLVVDDLDGLSRTLSEVAPAQLRSGSIRIAVWSYAWLSRAHFLQGDWDSATEAAERAVALLEQTGHDWLRPLISWVASAVPTARGDWLAAERHVARGGTEVGDCELMVVPSALSAAELAWARGNSGAVLDALAPVRDLPAPRQGIDEPGFWPWAPRYADAMVSAGRLNEAAEFLTPHEQLATARGRRSSIARLANVRGRLEAALGRPDEAEVAFQHGLAQLDGLSLPFERSVIELAYGQMLRRLGRRRAALRQLLAAREQFEALAAHPFVARCDAELVGSGLAPSKRRDLDPNRLTRQESAVATRAAAGMTNRDIASDMTISVKTVQFHVGNIYSKLGVHSRLQLANALRDQSETAPEPGG